MDIIVKREETLNSITRVLCTTSKLALRENWTTFAESLGVPSVTIRRLRSDLLLSKSTFGDLIRNILEEWVGRNGSDAKLSCVLHALEECGAGGVGERLRESFDLSLPPPQSTKDTTDDLFVGSENCPFETIRSIVLNDPKLQEEWKLFATELGIPLERIKTFELDLNLEKSSEANILLDILALWVDKQGSNAKLNKLIHVIEESCESEDAGQSLRSTFNLPVKIPRPKKPTSFTAKEKVEARLKRILDEMDEKSPNKKRKAGHPIWFDAKRPTDLFTGRDKELTLLDDKLKKFPDKPLVISQVTSIAGLGGIGKTELARKYLDERRAELGNVIWIDAEEEVNMAESFKRLAKDELNISTINANGKEKNISTIVKEVYQHFSNQTATFVFDNAEKGKTLEQFMPLNTLHPDKKPFILITSRDREWPSGTEVINLNELELKDAIKLVERGLEMNQEGDEYVRKLVETLQCFPLAIRQAIAYIKEQRFIDKYDIKDYLEEYEVNGQELLGNEDIFQEMFNDYSKTTCTTWRMTVKKIGEEPRFGALAKKILNIIGYLAPDKIPVDLFLALGENERVAKQAIRLLVKYSMVNAESGLLSVHRLVQEVTRIELKTEDVDEIVMEEVLSLLNDNLKKETLSHGAAALAHCRKSDKLVKRFCSFPERVVRKLVAIGKFEEAKALAEISAERLYFVDKTNVNLPILKLAISCCLAFQGRYGESLKIYSDVLERARRSSGNIQEIENHIQIQLGKIIPLLEKYDEGRALMERVIERLSSLGEDTLQTLKSLKDKALIYYKSGDLAGWLKLLCGMLELIETLVGEEHPEYFQVTLWLSQVYLEIGRLDEAEAFAKLLSGTPGRDELRAEICFTLGRIAFKKKELGDAALHTRKAVELAQTFGEDNPLALKMLMFEGNIFLEQGNCDSALLTFRRVLELNEGDFTLKHKCRMGIVRALLSNSCLEEAQQIVIEDLVELEGAGMAPEVLLSFRMESARLLLSMGRRNEVLGILTKAEINFREGLGDSEMANSSPKYFELLILMKGLNI